MYTKEQLDIFRHIASEFKNTSEEHRESEFATPAYFVRKDLGRASRTIHDLVREIERLYKLNAEKTK